MDNSDSRWVGKPLARFEDVQLLRGEGNYLDDIEIEGQLYMRVVRSTYPRAKIISIDASQASGMAGVAAIYTAMDFRGIYKPVRPMVAAGVEVRDILMPLIADEVVNFVGEPVAIVVADTKAHAEDAAELVAVEYEPLTSVVSVKASLEGDELIHGGTDSNILMTWQKKSDGFEDVIGSAERFVEGNFELPRLVAAPMEPRGCVISWDKDSDTVTMWVSSQDPHRPRAQLAQMFGIPVEKIKAIVPEVGGAFGSKGGSPQEYLLAYASSKKLGRPIKWIEDRSENFISSYQGRGIGAKMRLALDGEGRFLALEAELLADLGAYLLPSTPIAPVTASGMLTGAYRIPGAKISLTGVATNKVPTGPYRGAGRPEACYFIERIVEVAAGELGMDPVELRMKNLIMPEEFPYRTALGQTYDSGDYVPALLRAVELLNAGTTTTEDDAGSVTSVGIAMSVEPAGAGFWESGGVEIRPDGNVIAISGSSAHGQGHKTTFAQILADELGVDIEAITVLEGDSDYGPGVGTFGSRSVLLGGEALVIACNEVKAIAADWAASRFEASVEDLVWESGRVHVRGSLEPTMTLFEIAREMGESEDHLSLKSKTRSDIPGASFPFGAYGAEARIDLDTGLVKLKRIVAVDDAGTIINPLLAECQIIGGTLQGVSSALWEEMVYDDDGMPVSASFIDYLIPSAEEADYEAETEFRTTPTPYTALGAKGVGESGTVGALAAVANSVNAGLAKIGFSGNIDPPYSPEKIWNTLRRIAK